MIPEAQQHFLRGILRISLIREQRTRKAVDLITMPLAQNPEFNLAYHAIIAYNAQPGEIVTTNDRFWRKRFDSCPTL